MINWIKQFLKRILTIFNKLKLGCKETNAALFMGRLGREENLRSKMLVTAHSLEKGMGIKKTRAGYGEKKAQTLLRYLNQYRQQYKNTNFYAYLESVGILQSYLSYQTDEGIEIPSIRDEFEKICLNLSEEQQEIVGKYKCGCTFYTKEAVIEASTYDFEKFATLRHSIRDFEDKVVERGLLEKAIQIANTAPSACNRQPVKVYCTKNVEKAAKIGELLSGNKAFTQNVRNFAIITCDRACFEGNEQYQWYINGGIYLSYFLLALHSLGIGSCTMQWFAFSQNEKRLKKAIGASKTEAIIAVICYGYYTETVKCICAQRKSVDETLSFV